MTDSNPPSLIQTVLGAVKSLKDRRATTVTAAATTDHEQKGGINYPVQDTLSSSPLSLYEDIDSMLAISYLIQVVALFNHWDETVGSVRRRLPYEPDLFRTLPRTLPEILEWLRQNMKPLKNAKLYTLRKYDPVFSFDGLKAILVRGQQMERKLRHEQKRQPKSDDAIGSTDKENDDNQDDILGTLEFLDDEFGFKGSESKPVWGIIRNPLRKRLTVAFRGSTNSQDCKQDLKAYEREVSLSKIEILDKIPNPNKKLLQMFADKKVVVHHGFFEYLFEAPISSPTPPTSLEKQEDSDSGNCNENNDDDRATIPPKFDKILKECITRLKDPKNEGYTLFFTGHSLGGALATLAAAACSMSNDIKEPIKLITFASPQVGKESFAEAFHELEKAGRIRHLRITNDDDAVPIAMSVLGYVHTTTSAHLNIFSDSSTSNDDGNSSNNNDKDLHITSPNCNYNLSVPIIEMETTTTKNKNTNNADDGDKSKDNGMHNKNESERVLSKLSPLVLQKLKDLPISHKWILGNPSHTMQEHKRRIDKTKDDFGMFNFDDLFNTTGQHKIIETTNIKFSCNE